MSPCAPQVIAPRHEHQRAIGERMCRNLRVRANTNHFVNPETWFCFLDQNLQPLEICAHTHKHTFVKNKMRIIILYKNPEYDIYYNFQDKHERKQRQLLLRHAHPTLPFYSVKLTNSIPPWPSWRFS